ncbi:uncharacterized protein [Amphiura filiformis]|uniref:uncharacterized protein n=1 Tax=Amphiura filiformis TaxID=82378 RepID=UPI003B221A0A
MTLRMWRLLKRVFRDEVGWDVFGSLDKMQKEQRRMEFQYECGTVTATTGEKVHFVRVKDVKEVVTQLVTELLKAGELLYLNNLGQKSLWLHVSADKGGKSTKLILQVINQKDRHSIDNAKLLAYFEGKDNRVNMEEVFGPILEELQKCAANIAELQLVLPPVPLCSSKINPPCRDHTKCDESVPWTPLKPFDSTNTTYSADCADCVKCVCHPRKRTKPSSDPSEPAQPSPDPSEPNQPSSDPSEPNQPSSDPSEPALSSSDPSELQCDSGFISDDFQTPQTSTPVSDHQVMPEQDLTPLLQSPNPSCPRSNQSDSCMVTPHRPPPDNNLSRSLFPPKSQESPNSSHQSDSPIECSSIYTDCRFTVGGDWEGLAKLLGLSGPNGKYFCNHCLVLLSDVPKAKPHAVHILPKYQAYTNGLSLVVSTDDDFLRTFPRCEMKNAEYRAAGEKAKAMNFESCENRPLVTGDKVIDTFSTTPLHISLGIGQQVLTVIEQEAIKLDKEIQENEGQYDAFISAFEHKKEILTTCQSINAKIEKVDDKISQVCERKKDIIKDRAAFFKKNSSGRFVNNSELAAGVRNQYSKLDTEKASLIKEKEKHQKQLKASESKLDKVMAELQKVKGPFKTKLDGLLDSLKLKRAAYHSGALIGPDVKKLVTKQNIPKFGEVFTPMMFKKDGKYHLFGNRTVKGKVTTLLTKFKSCYDLYTANRSLCRHEVELLVLRCASFGCWFPVNFPEQNLKRKFHLLTVDVPKQARRMKTVGMITEQTIESIHPYINELDRRFAKVSDKTQKGLIICKQQNMYSQPTWNALKKRGKSGVSKGT